MPERKLPQRLVFFLFSLFLFSLLFFVCLFFCFPLSAPFGPLELILVPHFPNACNAAVL